MTKVLYRLARVGSKRMFAVCCFAFSAASSLFAVPACPKMVEYRQVNGETIPICLKGDEFCKYAISEDGYTLLADSKGNYCYATTNSVGDLVSSGVIARSVENRSDSDKSFLSKLSKRMSFSPSQKSARQKSVSDRGRQMSVQKAFPTKGSRKLLCILVQFSDVKFTLSRSSFNNLFNASSYSTGGASGSVKKYFDEVSYSQLSLQTDVVGPYIVSQTMAYYGANDSDGDDLRPRELVKEACNAAANDVDFSDYDNDGDGYVDGVYVIYAGYDESAGASANAIWAHKWSLASSLTLDGVRVYTYSCSSELRGTSGSGITMPGVICHEFGHVLGAPDFYDIDYEDNGEYDGTGEWDLQANGSWNGSPQGASPAHPNPYTKAYIYGWTTVTTLHSTQNVTINPSASNKNAFYRVDVSTDGEFYLFENRQQIGFDAGLPGYGLMIYHGTSSAETQGMNSTHPQNFHPVAANSTFTLPTGLDTYGTINSSTCPWPSSTKTSFSYGTTPSLRSWAGSNTGYSLSNIKKNGTGSSGTVSFSFTSTGSSETTVDLADALDNTVLEFTTGGDAVWFGQTGENYDGTDAAQSGAISASQNSWMQTTVTGPGRISFYWNVSSEGGNWDYLEFLIDGVQTNKIGGTNVSWTQQTYDIPSGTHTLKWNYRKDGSVDSGSDCGWVDRVVWTKAGGDGLTSQGVPYIWLEMYGLAGSGGSASDYESAAICDSDGDGYANWQEYVMGSSPLDEESFFKIYITIEDGKPKITWKPDYGGGRVYTIEGCAELGGGWKAVNTDADKAEMRFFKVKVALP